MQPGDPGGHLRGRAVAGTAVPLHLLFPSPASLPPPRFSPPLQPPHLLLHSLPAPTPPSLLPCHPAPPFSRHPGPQPQTSPPALPPPAPHPHTSPLPPCFSSSPSRPLRTPSSCLLHPSPCCSSGLILRPCSLPGVPFVVTPTSHPFCSQPLRSPPAPPPPPPPPRPLLCHRSALSILRCTSSPLFLDFYPYPQFLPHARALALAHPHLPTCCYCCCFCCCCRMRSPNAALLACCSICSKVYLPTCPPSLPSGTPCLLLLALVLGSPSGCLLAPFAACPRAAIPL